MKRGEKARKGSFNRTRNLERNELKSIKTPVGFENYDKTIVWVNEFPSLKLVITKKMHFPENITHSQVSDGANQERFIKRNEYGFKKLF